ncbi:MAG: hypothetical protein ABIY50_12265 [Ignavibacteria bacterium]
MQYKIIVLVFFTMMICTSVNSQQNPSIDLGNGFSLMPNLIYVSSATVQLNPFSVNEFERSLTEELSGGYGYGLAFRKKFLREDLSFGISTEFIRIVDRELTETFENDSVRYRVRVSEELSMIPIEFTGYFNIPDFSEDLKIYLGGGVGVYFGDRKRTVLNIQSTSISKQAGFSFVVLSGVEYFFTKNVSGVFEMRFRQAEYKVKSEYPVANININGTSFPLNKNLNSKIFVDGLKLSLGLAYNF